MFHVIEKEMRWRRKNNLPEGFEALKNVKPIVAAGAEQPLGDQTMLADYFRTCHDPITSPPAHMI
jgi:hypothetical protein